MVVIEVRVVPKAKRERWTSSEIGGLKFHTGAPPVDGKANAALIKAMAERLRIPRSRFELIRGKTSRLKTLKIDSSMNSEEIVKKLINGD